MKTLLLIFATLVTQGLRADFPSYGYVKVTLSKANIYEGDSTKSKISGVAVKGDEFLLRHDKLFKGFYKIQYGGHPHFILASQVKFFPPEDAEATPEGEEVATLAPTPTVKKSATAKPTAKVTQEKIEETLTPTRVATMAATRVPTLIPDVEEQTAPTAIPTRWQATAAPTVWEPTTLPTPKPDWQEPTQISTRWVTAVPTSRPDWVEATAAPTRWVTAIPTSRPEWIEPTAIPTRWQPTPMVKNQPTQAYVAPTPDPWTQAQAYVAKGKRLKQQIQSTVNTYNQVTAQGQRRQTTRQQNQYANSNTTSGFQAQRASRLGFATGGGGGGKGSPGFSVFMPVGGGKPYNVRPAFRPDTSDPVERRIEEAGFLGLELEGHMFSFWRWTADWHYFTHATQATDIFMGFPVDTTLPLGAPIAFLDASSTYYAMDTHAFRLGMKFSVPLRLIEPWVGGTLGLYNWHADYRDKAKTVSYGEASGTAFGLTAAGGIDFKIRAGQGFFILTPFYEYGAPIVNPEIKDIAGLGVDWKDKLGTPVAIPSRFGLKLGWGF